METIKVNMSPNPLDVQTIHASQNDGEAREWEFELHNNGDVIDASEISDQLVFKAYKGGTEQILPENGSVPTTSPIIADIKYPHGEMTDQEFLYRQSPTEEDGLAKITDIKGNTLVWNQLVQQNGATETMNGVSFTNNNDGSWTVNGTATDGNPIKVVSSSFSLVNGHKYLVVGGVDGGANNTYRMDMRPVGGGVTKELYNEKEIWTSNVSANDIQIVIRIQSGITVNNFKYRPQVFDLTMLGINNLTNNEVLEWFANYFPLSYYSYNQGSLLSFNGNGIKTVGFNQWDEEWEVGTISVNTGMNVNDSTRIRSKNYIHVLGGKQYYIHGARITYLEYDANKTFLRVGNSGSFLPTADTTFTPSADASYIRFYAVTSYGTTYNHDICINISNPSKNGTYEPYTSSTLSLPISTYFPNGMDGVGDAYDELSNSGYAKRMGRIDLGSITYTRQESQTSGVYFFVGAYHSIPNIKNRANSVVWNIKTPLYETVPSTRVYQGFAQNKTIGGYDAQTVRIRDDSFTDATAFKNSLSGQYLVYELATPTETPITTASLVTENAEIPLSNEDGVLIGKCTEQLSENPGFIDAKIKLSDSDGECYSNKLQLHVERSPQ